MNYGIKARTIDKLRVSYLKIMGPLKDPTWVHYWSLKRIS